MLRQSQLFFDGWPFDWYAYKPNCERLVVTISKICLSYRRIVRLIGTMQSIHMNFHFPEVVHLMYRNNVHHKYKLDRIRPPLRDMASMFPVQKLFAKRKLTKLFLACSQCSLISLRNSILVMRVQRDGWVPGLVTDNWRILWFSNDVIKNYELIKWK